MLTNRHTEQTHNTDFNYKAAIVAAHNALTNLGWKIFYTGKQGYIAFADSDTEIKIVFYNENIQISGNSTSTESIPGYIEQFKEAFQKAMATTGAEAVAERYELISKSFEHEEVDAFSGNKDMLGTLGQLSIPVKNYFITPIIINANLLIYIIMVCCGVHFFSPEPQDMLAWGADFKPVTLDGEWWRMLTACFLHFGILHVLLNMYALAYIGLLLEPFMGRWRYLLAYLMAGVASSAVSIWWNDYVVSAGASGAIFGMYGVFLAMMVGNVVPKSAQKQLVTSIGFFVVLNLFIGFAEEGIDNAAHIGGLVSGFLIGLVMVPGIRKPQSAGFNFAGIAGALLLGLGSAYYAYNYSPNDLAKYGDLVKEFGKHEEAANNYLEMDKSKTDEDAALVIKTKILPEWQTNVKITSKIKALDLPPFFEKQGEMINKYAELKVENYTLLYKKVYEGTNAYDSRIKKTETEITSIIQRLNAADKKTK